MSRVTPAPATRGPVPPSVLLLLALPASTTLTGNEELLAVTTTGGAVVLTLPPAASVPAGTALQAVRVAGANDLSWLPVGTDTVNGVAGPYSYNTNGVSTTIIVSDGTGAWIVLTTSGSSVAATAVGNIVTTTAQIAIGTDTITTPNLGKGSLVGKRIVVSALQAAPDATATSFAAVGNIGGTVTVTSNANATALTTVAIWVDAR